MKTTPYRYFWTLPVIGGMAICLWFAPSAGRAADPEFSLPPGIIEFAGRVAHNHGYLFGEDQRGELEHLNRVLRESQAGLRSGDEAEKAAAAKRASAAVDALIALVRKCPYLLTVDLTGPEPRVDATGPVALPGDTGALLLAVEAGEGNVHFSTGWADLANPPGESSLVSLPAAPGALTYAVAGLENVPTRRTTLRLEIQGAGDEPARLPLDVTTPRPGRLQLTVLSDESGEPVPAMVRLLWRVDGLQRRPSNGIEFGPQFDNQGRATGARPANLPAPLNTPFWCVPGPFDMALSPGPWQIGIRRGVEHEVIFEEITIESGRTLEKTLRPRRWVDMRRHGWWSGDDHVHCRILSDQDAERLMAWVQAEEVHLANVVKMGDIYRTYFEQRGFGPDYRVIDDDYILSPGQECPRTHDQIGHTLAMNITAMVRDTDRYFLYDTVFDAVHAQGGLSGYAHVNSGAFHVHRDMSVNVPKEKVDFVEILQFNHLGTDLYYDFLNLGCKLTASAGSDVPWGGTVGEVRAYAFLGDQSFTADHWFEAFAKGHTFTTSGPMLEFRVDDALPGDEIQVDSPEQNLEIHARAWGEPQRMAPVRLEIVRHGEVIRSAESTDPADPAVEIDFSLPAEDGYWIAARALAGNGTHAHTTPVYVVRDGMRFWKFNQLDALLAARSASLDEIEAIIAEAQRLEAAGRLTNDRYRRQLALQGDALLERIAAAREIYAKLESIAASEKSRRLSHPDKAGAEAP